MKQSPAVSMKMLSESFRMIAIQLGTLLIPALMKATEWLGKLVKWFNKLNPEMKTFIAYAIPVVGALLLLSGKGAQLAATFMSLKSLMLFINQAALEVGTALA